MDLTRGLFLFVGLVAIIAGAFMLFFEAGLDRWVSMSILVAGVLIFVGLAVVGFATGAPRDPPPPRERRAPPREERLSEDRREDDQPPERERER